MDVETRLENELMQEIDELSEDYDPELDDLQPRARYREPAEHVDLARLARLERRVQQLEQWQREHIQPAFKTRPRAFQVIKGGKS